MWGARFTEPRALQLGDSRAAKGSLKGIERLVSILSGEHSLWQGQSRETLVIPLLLILLDILLLRSKEQRVCVVSSSYSSDS